MSVAGKRINNEGLWTGGGLTHLAMNLNTEQQPVISTVFVQSNQTHVHDSVIVKRGNVPTHKFLGTTFITTQSCHTIMPHNHATQSCQTMGGTQVKFMFPLQHSLTISKKSGNQADYTGVSNRWTGIWNGTVEWKMEWNDECTQL